MGCGSWEETGTAALHVYTTVERQVGSIPVGTRTTSGSANILVALLSTGTEHSVPMERVSRTKSKDRRPEKHEERA